VDHPYYAQAASSILWRSSASEYRPLAAQNFIQHAIDRLILRHQPDRPPWTSAEEMLANAARSCSTCSTTFRQITESNRAGSGEKRRYQPHQNTAPGSSADCGIACRGAPSAPYRCRWLQTFYGTRTISGYCHASSSKSSADPSVEQSSTAIISGVRPFGRRALRTRSMERATNSSSL
jgi:hypothetical protein